MGDYQVFAERERSGWAEPDRVDAYVKWFGPIVERAHRGLIASVAPAPDKTVLDLCCGHGALTSALTTTGARVFGLDFSAAMLRRAATAAPDAVLFHGDAAAMPFDDGMFDAVVCNHGLAHLPDQRRGLKEIRRVLKPHGRFAMTGWSAPDASPAFDVFLSAVKAHADLSTRPPQPDLFLYGRQPDADEMLGVAGLTIVSRETIHAAWTFSEPDQLYALFAEATVATRLVLLSQSDADLALIRSHVRNAVAEQFDVGGNYVVPVTFCLIVAQPL